MLFHMFAKRNTTFRKWWGRSGTHHPQKPFKRGFRIVSLKIARQNGLSNLYPMINGVCQFDVYPPDTQYYMTPQHYKYFGGTPTGTQ